MVFIHSVFSTQIFDIFTGPSKGHFMAHEAVLAQSPLLARLMQSQSNKKGKHKTTLVLLRESPANFGILLGYLYSHQLVMPDLNGEGSLNSDTDGTEAKAAAKVLARLYVLVGQPFQLSSCAVLLMALVAWCKLNPGANI